MSRGDSGLVGMPEHGSIAAVLADYERRLQALESANRLTSASIGSGGLRLKDGGTLTVLDVSGNVIAEFDVDGMTVFEADGSTLMGLDGTGLVLNNAAGTKVIDLTTAGLKAFEADGSVLVQLDGTGIRLNDGSGTKLIDLTTAGLRAYEADGSTLVVLDGSKLRFNRADGSRQLEITPAGGVKIYDTDGTTEKVVLDATGLEVDGGNVQAFWPFTIADVASNVSINTSATEVLSVTIDPPAWVEEVHLMSIGRFQISNTSGGAQNLSGTVINDANGTPDSNFGTHGSNDGVVSTVSFAVANRHSFTLPSAGQSFDVTTEATLNTGTNSSNRFDLSVLGFGVRSAFS